MAEVDEDVRRLADEWRTARRQLEDVSTDYPINVALWQERYDAEKTAERAYYRLLRERFGWNAPHGVELGD